MKKTTRNLKNDTFLEIGHFAISRNVSFFQILCRYFFHESCLFNFLLGMTGEIMVIKKNDVNLQESFPSDTLDLVSFQKKPLPKTTTKTTSDG